MSCNCNRNTNFHIITGVTISGSSANVTVTNSNNIGNLQPFVYRTQCNVSFTPPTTPIPVTITINGVNVPLLDHNGIQITTSRLPARGCGCYVANTTTTIDESTGEVKIVNPPYVILYSARTRRGRL